MSRTVGFLFGLNLKYATEKSGRFWISELLPETSTETVRSSGEADIGWVLGCVWKPCDCPGTEAGNGRDPSSTLAFSLMSSSGHTVIFISLDITNINVNIYNLWF